MPFKAQKPKGKRAFIFPVSRDRSTFCLVLEGFVYILDVMHQKSGLCHPSRFLLPIQFPPCPPPQAFCDVPLVGSWVSILKLRW